MSHYKFNKAYNEMKKAYLPRSRSPKKEHDFKLGTVLAVETRSRPCFREALLKSLKRC